MTALLVEMAIREISTQCTFAEISYDNINSKAIHNVQVVFSSIHSFLSHCANVSKFLWSNQLENGEKQNIASILNISNSYKINDREVRNALEHYDERLKKWVEESDEHVSIADFNIGPKDQLGIPKNSVLIRHYDPEKYLFTMLQKDLKLDQLFSEVIEIKNKADLWIESNTSFPKL